MVLLRILELTAASIHAIMQVNVSTSSGSSSIPSTAAAIPAPEYPTSTPQMTAAGSMTMSSSA